MRQITAAGIGLLIGFAPALPAQHDHPIAGLGRVSFPNSGRPAAQEPFLLGVALLHSFEYERAARAFREAERADPGFALAYWCEALTASHILWRVEDLGSARATLARLAANSEGRLARAGDARERSFGSAVEALFAEGPQPDRVRGYAAGMRRHASSYPDDLEAAAFAAHAIMLEADLAEPGSRTGLTREAIGLAQRVARANPQHPGAVHYLIHLYDAPGLAAEGLEFARAYDQIAPESEHALHMPSHIYLQLGLWEDVVRSNERAWKASRQEGAPDWHAFSWLQYAYLQAGRSDRARALLDSAVAIVKNASGDEAFAIPRLEFQYAAETGDWRRPVSAPRTNGDPATDRERGFQLFARYWQAVSATNRKDPALDALAGPFLAIADSALRGIGSARSRVQVANALVIRALVAQSRGDQAEYLAALQAAAERERAFGPFVGPPERVFALELLGEELERQGRKADAAEAYRAVLRLCPNRRHSVDGLVRMTRQ
jgi:tetratricopeptide (TPR) repeat protein